MIKRPLLWLFWPFVAGIMYYQFFEMSILFFFCFIFISILSFILYSLFNRLVFRFNSFHFCLRLYPFLYLVGFLLAYGQDPGKNPVLELHEFQKVTIEGIVSDVTEKSTYQEVVVKNVHLYKKSKKHFYQRKIVVKESTFTDLVTGDQVVAQGEMKRCEQNKNPGNYDEQSYYKAKNIFYKVDKAMIIKVKKGNNFPAIHLHKLKKRIQFIYSQVLDESDSSVICAMILGDKSRIDVNLKELYQKAGIAHILAISGLHISLIGLFCFKGLKKIGLHHNHACIVCILFLYLYGMMTGFSISTVRAVAMMVLALAACLFNRTYDTLSAVAFAGFLILVKYPFALFSCSFLLSFSAITGAVWFYPVCKNQLDRSFQKLDKKMQIKRNMQSYSFSVFVYTGMKKVVIGMFVSVAIQLVTLPILLWFFFSFSVLAPVLNLFILPLMTLLLLLAIMIVISGVLFLPGAYWLAGSVHYILKFYQVICTIFNQIPFQTMITGRPQWWQVVLYYVFLVCFVLCIKRWHGCRWFLMLVLSLCILLIKVPPSGLHITFVDIGQGDCTFMKTETGLTILTDGGSVTVKNVGKYRLIPFLKEQGVASLDYCFLTHMDADHINGVLEILALEKQPGNVKIKNIILPKTNFEDEALINMAEIARNAGTVVSYVERGDCFTNGKLKMFCLHPYREFPAETRNDYSTVMEVSYDGFTMLLTGDIGEDAEKSMLSDDLFHFKRYDLLKAAHHGSKFSSCQEWMERVKPKLTVISSGWKNPFGHPHKETLERYKMVHSKIMKTMDSGAVTVKYRKGKGYVYGCVKE